MGRTRKLRLDFDIYNAAGERCAAAHHLEDAAAFVGVLGEGCTVRFGSRGLWTEGSEEFSASESYDGAAEIMQKRIPSAQRERFDALHGVRTDGQIHLGPLNLDGMTGDDLRIASTHPALHERVQRYAYLAISARLEREQGRIEAAAKIERAMERIYETEMPKACRW